MSKTNDYRTERIYEGNCSDHNSDNLLAAIDFRVAVTRPSGRRRCIGSGASIDLNASITATEHEPKDSLHRTGGFNWRKIPISLNDHRSKRANAC